MKSFKKWTKEEGILLKPWQAGAAEEFLLHLEKQQSGARGKSFLMRTLSKFIAEHGNDFSAR